jgi:predicted DNA-binding helix-hairpin-helix protein
MPLTKTERLFYNVGMNATEKLKVVAGQMTLEPAEEIRQTAVSRVAPCGQVVDTAVSPHKKEALGIYNAVLPGGKTAPLLKTLLTSACERSCYYCPFRAGRNYRRTTFKPEEMAKLFMDMYRAGMVQGLFLSSGIIKGGIHTQDKLLAVAEILRRTYHFRGYLHLKIMPGAEKAQIEQAMTLADRLSVNLEAPNDRRLAALAPHKQFMQELVRPLRIIEEIRRQQSPRQGWQGRWPSTTTQFVVGGTDETDLELLATTNYLIRSLGLTRVYFSGFRPIADTPLENRTPIDPMREHRLYQTSFLLRDYAFDLEELPFDASGNLPLDSDPKLAWARQHLTEQPVEVNRASRRELLRVPGIGPKGAAAILRARRQGTLRHLHDLRQIGVRTHNLAPFVLLDGKRPFRQLHLFDTW